jgi:CubicO group peptidase (beta-lactamase class C family)
MSTIPGLPAALPEEIGLSAAGLERITAIFRRDVERKLLPGAVLAIARHGKLGYLETLGVRDPATGVAMTADTIFRIYSMTKPIVSTACMMLLEEGRFAVADPLAKYLPAYAKPKVGVVADGKLELVPAKHDITIQDLLRHTAGFTYDFTGNSPIHKMYHEARLQRRDQTAAEHAADLAKLPLLHQPGVKWDYSRAVDVLGHLVELWSGQSLGTFLAERIFKPLGMVDTGFFVPKEKHARLAEPFRNDPETGEPIPPLVKGDPAGVLMEVRDPPKFESGGGGLVSTIDDYMRYCQMLANGGSFDGARILGRKTVEWMTADHLLKIDNSHFLLAPNLGFGLGFAVQRETGGGPTPGSTGMYFWGGLAGTTFWVDRQEGLTAALMVQAPGQRNYVRALFRDAVYAALAD